jgi:hypothetical protein
MRAEDQGARPEDHRTRPEGYREGANDHRTRAEAVGSRAKDRSRGSRTGGPQSEERRLPRKRRNRDQAVTRTSVPMTWFIAAAKGAGMRSM